MVQTERARLDRDNQMKRKFLRTGDLELPQPVWYSYRVYNISKVGRGRTMVLLLPQANLKAKDLPSDLFPHKEIIKAYTDAGHDFNFDSDGTIQDRGWRSGI